MSGPVPRPRLGVSACLLGQRVRYDGGHKRDGFVADLLARHFELVAVCPELESGLGVPRESLRLVARAGGPRLVAPRSGTDHTETLRAWAEARVAALQALDLCGFVLKKDSPTCGLERVRVYDTSGMPHRGGRGLFAQVLSQRCPLLPLEEEGRLSDERLREGFVTRVLAYRRLRDLFAWRWTPGALVAFHTREKLLLLAHSPAAYRTLGRMVAQAGRMAREELQERYAAAFMAAVAGPARPGRVRNALQHMAGYLKGSAGADDRRELGALIDEHAAGRVPLLAPLTLLRHHVRSRGIRYLERQSWLGGADWALQPRRHA